MKQLKVEYLSLENLGLFQPTFYGMQNWQSGEQLAMKSLIKQQGRIRFSGGRCRLYSGLMSK